MANTNNIDSAAKEKALQQALDQIQKQYGKGAFRKGSGWFFL